MQKTITCVDLNAIRSNAKKLRAVCKDKKLFAVVKADAYGHGAEEVAREIEDIVEGFCVAIADEGAALRVAGISKPVLVFTPPLDTADVRRAAHYNLDVTVNSQKTAMLCKGAPCHIKVNTGMNRTGCPPKDFLKVFDSVKGEILGVYSHLYAAENTAAAMKQLALFKSVVAAAKARNSNICAHLSASGGILRGGEFLFDGVRAGILLYGYAPSGFSAKGYLPAMKVYAKKVQDTPFIGGGVGYNRADKKYKNLSVYRLGYADGFRRNVPLGEKTLCMDTFISESGEEYKCVLSNAEEYAASCGTISYEVLTSVTRRSERVYLR